MTLVKVSVSPSIPGATKPLISAVRFTVLPCPSVTEPLFAIGPGSTVTSIVAGVACAPMLSLIVMVSDPAVASVSDSVASAALTWLRVPPMVNVLPPFDGVTVAPAAALAASTPLLSVSTAVKFSPLIVGVSAMPTPVIARACPTPTIAAVGAMMTGATTGAPTWTPVPTFRAPEKSAL